LSGCNDIITLLTATNKYNKLSDKNILLDGGASGINYAVAETSRRE
jgi:hypothetical protein